MSAYATIADLTKYGIATAALADVPTDALQAALDGTCAIVDSYLRDRFALPLSSWDVSLTLNVAKMAAFEALRLRGFAPEGIDQSIRDGYTDGLKWLQKVGQGDVTPSVVDASGSTESSPNGPFVMQARISDTTDANGYPTFVTGPPIPRGWR